MLIDGWISWFNGLQLVMFENLGDPEKGIAYGLFRDGWSVEKAQDYLMARRGHKTHRHYKRDHEADIRSEKEFQALLAKQEKEDKEFRSSRVNEAVSSAFNTLAKKNKPHLKFPSPTVFELESPDMDYAADEGWNAITQQWVQKLPKQPVKPKTPRKVKPKVKTVDTNVTRRINLDE